MSKMFNVVDNDATAVDALEDVVKPLAGEAEMAHVGEGQRLGDEQEELVGEFEEGGHVGVRGLRATAERRRWGRTSYSGCCLCSWPACIISIQSMDQSIDGLTFFSSRMLTSMLTYLLLTYLLLTH